MPGLCCCALSLVLESGGFSSPVVCRLLTVVASLTVERGLWLLPLPALSCESSGHTAPLSRTQDSIPGQPEFHCDHSADSMGIFSGGRKGPPSAVAVRAASHLAVDLLKGGSGHCRTMGVAPGGRPVALTSPILQRPCGQAIQTPRWPRLSGCSVVGAR